MLKDNVQEAEQSKLQYQVVPPRCYHAGPFCFSLDNIVPFNSNQGRHSLFRAEPGTLFIEKLEWTIPVMRVERVLHSPAADSEENILPPGHS